MLLSYSAIFTALLSAFLGCEGCYRGCDQSRRNDEALVADAAPAPLFEATDRPPPDAYLNDALWRRAIENKNASKTENKNAINNEDKDEDKDEIDLASLADREGASGLLEAVEIGGSVGLTALAALPWADDAHIAFHRLAQLVLMTKGDAQLSVLRSIHGIAAKPLRYGEPIDEGGASRCAQVLLRIARDVRVQATHRAVAISALRLPVFVAYVDAAMIPTDLDAQSAVDSSPQ